jgi:hypothetical protein
MLFAVRLRRERDRKTGKEMKDFYILNGLGKGTKILIDY